MRRDALGDVGRRQRVAAVSAIAILGLALSIAGAYHSFAAESGPAEFADGWRKEVALADPNGGDKTPRCVARVDDGWLVVELRDTAGDIEWQIVLAEVGEDDEPPTIEPNPNLRGGLRLTYRNGLFFIRDDWGRLRCLRQKKTADVPWPALDIPKNEPQPGGQIMGKAPDRPFYYARENHGWQFIACGADGEKAEYVLRMYCLEVGAFQFSSRGDGSGADYTVGAEYGSIHSSAFTDDGELLVARRMSEKHANLYRAELEKLTARRIELVGAAAPAIPAAKWLNGDAIALDDLKGKAALVYFAGGYSERVAKELSALDELYGKYHDVGLEAVAVIPSDDEEVYEAIGQKRAWRLPLAVDDRRYVAAQRFSVTDTPSYFLIGRDGKIAEGRYSERIRLGAYKRPPPLPNAEEIEKLLPPGEN